MKKYTEAKIGTLKGEFLEPVSPIYTISNKYYYPEDIRKELHGTSNTFQEFDPLLLERLKKTFESKNIPKAYDLIARY
jgi:hypothetical protein